MRTIELTQGQVALVDDRDYDELSRFKWYALRDHGGTFYAQRHAPRVDGKQRTILMHRVILDVQPGQDVDHANHDTLDNRRQLGYFENEIVAARAYNIEARARFKEFALLNDV